MNTGVSGKFWYNPRRYLMYTYKIMHSLRFMKGKKILLVITANGNSSVQICK